MREREGGGTQRDTEIEDHRQRDRSGENRDTERKRDRDRLTKECGRGMLSQKQVVSVLTSEYDRILTYTL